MPPPLIMQCPPLPWFGRMLCPNDSHRLRGVEKAGAGRGWGSWCLYITHANAWKPCLPTPSQKSQGPQGRDRWPEVAQLITAQEGDPLFGFHPVLSALPPPGLESPTSRHRSGPWKSSSWASPHFTLLFVLSPDLKLLSSKSLRHLADVKKQLKQWQTFNLAFAGERACSSDLPEQGMNQALQRGPRRPGTLTALLPRLAPIGQGKAGNIPRSVLLLCFLQMASKSTP